MQAGKTRMIRHICICLLFFFSIPLSAQEYGLKFYGHDVTLDKRTELNLTPENFLNLEDEFEISFDLKLDIITPDNIFGYVFRIVNQEDINVDLLSTPTPVGQLNLVIGNNNSVVPVGDATDFVNNWFNFRIKFFLSEDRMVFYTPDSFYVYTDIGFQAKDAFKIIYGANDYQNFKTTDVPSISIRNIRIYERGKLKYYWPLDLRHGSVVKDEIKGKPALVKNPNWLMLSHQSWQLEFKEKYKGYYLTAIDKKNEVIYFLGNQNYHIYSVEEQTFLTKSYNNQSLDLSSNYGAIYNPNDGKVYCYMIDDKQFSSLDTETGEWKHSGFYSYEETKHRHHNSYFDTINNSVYLLGGYGFHKYSNDVIKLDFKDNKVHNLSTNNSIFHPRYLAGLGALNDTVYLFGGYGSETGNQLINPQSYYDLIGYSITEGKFFEKFEVRRIIDDMAVANSMWIDPQTRDFYALIFEKSLFDGYLQLIKGNLDNPGVEMRGDKIPFKFLDIRSYAGLFYSKMQNKLYAFSTYHSENNETHISVHSISYPPDISVEQPLTVASKKNVIILISFLSVAVLILLYILFRRKLKKRNALKTNDTNTQVPVGLFEAPQNNITIRADYQIIFFGGFQVFDKDNNDITNKFSPLLKELFLLITLFTFKNNKGISSEKITEILWFDKSEKSARNNRAVNIAKLRNILNAVGTCELTKKTGYWKIIPETNEIKSDYIDFLQITNSKTNLTKEKIIRLIEITQKGPFLHNLQYEWLDAFKASVSGMIIDTLIEFASSCDIKKEPEFVIQLADCVFNFDIINEDAMILKCRAEYYLGKHSLAKTTYEKFFKEYKIMYAQEYDKSFLKVLEISN